MESCFIVEEKGKVWKDEMERVMNEKNDWDHGMIELGCSRRSGRLCE